MPQVTRNHVVSSGRTFALAAPPAAEIALMHASSNVFLAAELLDPFLLTEGYRAKVDTKEFVKYVGRFILGQVKEHSYVLEPMVSRMMCNN